MAGVNMSICIKAVTASVLALACTSITLTVSAEAVDRDDLTKMNKLGVKIAFDSYQEPDPIPIDIDKKKLKQVQLLDLSRYQIGDDPEFYQWLRGFTELRKLVLHETAIVASPEFMSIFDNMHELKILDLSHNPLFTGDYSNASLTNIWGKLPKLDELDLTNTQGTVENYGSLAGLNHLVILKLGNNPHLCDLSPLQSILSSFKHHCIPALELNQLPLSELVLSNTKLDKDPLPFLPINTLRMLSLDNNPIPRLSAPEKQDLPQLEYLNVTDNPNLVIDASLSTDRRLKALQCLERDNKTTMPDRLQKIPQCTSLINASASETTTPPVAPSVPQQSSQPSPRQPTQAKTQKPVTPPAAYQTSIQLPQTSKGIYAWLSGADKVKRTTVWQYLNQEAKQQDKAAYHWLGRAYHQGLNVTPDWIKARSYYEQALAAGDTSAKHSIDMLDLEASYVLQQWANEKKAPKKASLAQTLYQAIAQGNDEDARNAKIWLERLP